MSRIRLSSTVSFQAGRTMGLDVPRMHACSCERRSGTSLGECSVSRRIQSKPLPAITSVAMLLHRLLHSPICSRPSAMACLNALRGNSIGSIPQGGRQRLVSACGSDELDGDAAERTEIGVERVALARIHDTG